MTDQELKKLKDDLWHSADVLRAGAHLAANKYGQPILGLIFLRYADILFKQHKEEIMAEYEKYKGGRMEKSIKQISIEKCGFYLPECAYYDEINNAPDDANKATLVKNAMEAIEKENPKMEGVLPKEVYAQLVPEEEPELLSNIVRIFKDIPESCTVDIFGEIYEYFLGNFALAEGKDGGAFYTPATVVRYMVEVLAPQPGEKKFLDPACGSGGMFVQAARYMHSHNSSEAEQMKFRCYGVEKEPDTVKLAKMNLLLNNVRGEITEANSFYADPYNAFGQFDYVMANPPFNVDEVVVDRVSDDIRFNTYGVPRNKTKSAKKKSDKKETVPNANYLWIGYFATALNEHGKAALQQFVDRSLKTLADQKVEALSEEVADLTPAELNVRISETLNEIAATESSLDVVVEKSRRLADKIIEIDSQVSECRMLKNRYRSLMSQYESDIKRLTFIAEGDLHRGDIPKLDHCPFCNGELTKDQGESCVEAAIVEVQKIEAQIRDLRAANTEIVAEIKELDMEIRDLNWIVLSLYLAAGMFVKTVSG